MNLAEFLFRLFKALSLILGCGEGGLANKLSFIGYQGNANQNCTESPSHPCQDAHYQESKLLQLLARVLEGGALTGCERINWCNHCGKLKSDMIQIQ